MATAGTDATAPGALGRDRPLLRRPWVRRAAMLAATVLLLWLTVRAVGAQALLDGAAVLTPLSVVAALAVGLVVALSQALRWRVLAAGQGIRMPFRQAVRDCYASAFGNMVLPGGLGGDAARLVVYRDQGRRRWWSPLLAVGAERLSGTAWLFTAATVVLTLAQAEVPALVAGVAAVVFLAAAVACMRGVPLTRQVLVWAASAVSVAALLGLFLLGMAVLGGPVHAPVAVTGLASMSVPVGVGGWGVREFSVGALAPELGASAERAVTMAAGYGLLATVSTLPGAAVLLWTTVTRRRPQPPETSGQLSPSFARIRANEGDN